MEKVSKPGKIGGEKKRKDLKIMTRAKTEKKVTRETLTVEEAAKVLGVGVKKIYQLIKDKRLPTVEVRRPIRIPEGRFRKLMGLD